MGVVVGLVLLQLEFETTIQSDTENIHHVTQK